MKNALIVDDSRVARAVLRKTLVGFGIDVDEVPTAEAAIEYLKVDAPDIIFLDHMMPGMDGFDALTALKANPSTAMIPVLMYTTQEGQFYASQARALGAVDVLPKSLAPADVERILRSHHLIGESRRMPIEPDDRGIVDRDDLMERFRTIVDDRADRLMAEFRRELSRSQSATEAQLDRMCQEFKPTQPPPSSNRIGIAGSLAALALVAAVALPLLPNRQIAGVEPGPSPSIAFDTPMAFAETEPGPEAAPAPQPLLASAPEPVAESEPVAIGSAIGRQWNTTQSYPYGAVPLDDERARDYAQLLSQLKSEGFAGTVTFDIYEGRHCVNYRADGFTQLAPPDQPVTACDYIGTPTPGAALQSPMFENMIASVTRDGQIRVDTVSHGTNDPIIDYPALDYSLTAAEWNSIADINQRVSMQVQSGDAGNLSESVAYLGN